MAEETKKIEEEKFVPNTTPIPNILLDVWMDRLSDVEFRVVMTIARQTMGWIEDKETGRRKERDWISQSQLVEKTGRSRRQISAATKVLVDELGIVQALNEKGKILDAKKRQRNFGKVFYRLDLKLPIPTLFDKKTLKNSAFFRERKSHTEASREHFSRTRKSHTTKETVLQNKNINNTLQSTPSIAPEVIKKEEKKAPSSHKEFIEFWSNLVPRTRGIKPVIITGSDARNLKRVLELGVDPISLQKMALFFLADYSFKKFSPSISTFLSSGIITGLMNRTNNDPDFWKNLNQYQDQYMRGSAADTIKVDRGFSSIRDAMSTLLAKYSAHKESVSMEKI